MTPDPEILAGMATLRRALERRMKADAARERQARARTARPRAGRLATLDTAKLGRLLGDPIPGDPRRAGSGQINREESIR